MPASQSRVLLLGLLTGSLITTATWADTVVVNTTTDENNIDNTSCSIREAVSYLKAKNDKKAIIDEEIAVIAGTSLKNSNQLIIAQKALTDEKAKTSPSASEISRLEKEIADLTNVINNGLFSLNIQLAQKTDELNKEKSKSTPDNNLIASYDAAINTLKDQIKQKETERTQKESDLLVYRLKGLYGCISFDFNTADNVSLFANLGTYSIDSTITLPFSVNFALLGTDASSNAVGVINLEDTTNPDALPRTILKATASHNIFIIDDGKDNDHDSNPATSNQYITVTFNNIDFLGCDNNCATNGGIILNKEFLTITNSVIAKGVASEKGGAIYNAANSVLSIKNAVIKNNRAESGSAIFSEDANLALSSSLIADNETTNINNGVITLNKTLKASPYAPITPLIENSTISGNKGIGLNIQEGIFVNTSTVVQNTVGISFNFGLPTVYNSIIAGNSTLDCQSFSPIPADNKAYFANNLSVKDKGCPTTNVFNSLLISNTGAETLMAATDSKGRCAAPPAVGLLCPLANNGGLTRTHKPRLLASYTKLNDSVIVNKGFNVNKNSAGLACSSLDQRGKPRENNENACDIGAVELISGLSSSRQGDDIVFGQIKRFSPLENLGDAELLPAELCANFLGAGEYINGCIRVIDLPRHGQASIDTQTGELLYSTTKTDFHGFDTFSYGVITTLSRFNDANNDRTLTTSVRVVSEPPSSPPSKALDNGANGIFSILMLSLVAIWRRIYRGQ